MFPKPKKPKKKTLKNKADRIFSLYIRQIGYCQLKGKDNINCGGYLQTAHIITRGAHAIRWNPLNALCICQGHHVYYTHHPREWEEMIQKYFPENWEFVEAHRTDIWDKDIDAVLERLNQYELVIPT